MLEWVLAGAIGAAGLPQDAADLTRLKTCVAHMLVVETAVEQGQWAAIPGAQLPRPGSRFRTVGMILLLDAFAKAAERAGVDVASLAPEVEALAQQAPRAQSAGDVAMALKREGDCFRMLGVEEPQDQARRALGADSTVVPDQIAAIRSSRPQAGPGQNTDTAIVMTGSRAKRW